MKKRKLITQAIAIILAIVFMVPTFALGAYDEGYDNIDGLPVQHEPQPIDEHSILVGVAPEDNMDDEDIYRLQAIGSHPESQGRQKIPGADT